MPELILPRKAPAHVVNLQTQSLDYAVYTLVDLGNGGADALQAALKHPDGHTDNRYRLSSQYDFQGRTLRDIFEYHVEMAEKDDFKFDPTMFVVAHSKDYGKDGVLIVCLDTDGQGTIQATPIKCSEAVLALINIGIGNMDFEDFAEDGETFAPESGHQPDLVKFDPTGDEEEPPTQPDSRRPDEERRLFGIYGAITGANVRVTHDLLEPGRMNKHPNEEMFVGIGSYGQEQDPVQSIVQMHPWHCMQNKKMHRHWIVCIDNTDPEREGVLLVYVDWDGNIEREGRELVEIGRQAQSRSERTDVGNALITLMAR